MLAAVHPAWTRHPMSITLADDPYYHVAACAYSSNDFGASVKGDVVVLEVEWHFAAVEIGATGNNKLKATRSR